MESTTPAVDVTKMPIEINGQNYYMSLKYGDLAAGEASFRRQGHPVNLLVSLGELSLESAREVFPVAVHKWHPELSWSQAQALVTLSSAHAITFATLQAWNAATENSVPQVLTS